MAARLVPSLPDGGEWLYEVKLDGYRALLSKHGASVRLRSRNDKDLAAAYPTIVAAGRELVSDSVLLDGEVVAVGPDGVPSFQALQHRASSRDHQIVFYAFDLLFLDGHSLTERPLHERRSRLPEVLGTSGLLLSETLEGSAEHVTAAVRGLGLEGVVAKRRDSRYEAGQRSGAWQKVKLESQQEFVIGGYRPGDGGVDALVVGYYEKGTLRFAAKVRAGFTPQLRTDVQRRLARLHVNACPFSDLPASKTTRWGGGITAEQMTEFRWVKPQLAAQVRFIEWTGEGHLRHSAFVGLREDKAPASIRREGPFTPDVDPPSPRSTS